MQTLKLSKHETRNTIDVGKTLYITDGLSMSMIGNKRGKGHISGGKSRNPDTEADIIAVWNQLKEDDFFSGSITDS